MPKLLDRLVKRLKKQGKKTDSAWAIATSQLQKYGYLRKGSRKLTKKGKLYKTK